MLGSIQNLMLIINIYIWNHKYICLKFLLPDGNVLKQGIDPNQRIKKPKKALWSVRSEIYEM